MTNKPPLSISSFLEVKPSMHDAWIQNWRPFELDQVAAPELETLFVQIMELP
jgi:hypothetical protein